MVAKKHEVLKKFNELFNLMVARYGVLPYDLQETLFEIRNYILETKVKDDDE